MHECTAAQIYTSVWWRWRRRAHMHHIAQGNSSQQRTKKICKTACVGTCLPRQPSMSSIALLNKYRKQFIFYEQKRGCVSIVPQAARLQLLFRLLQFFIHAVTFVVAQTYYRVCYGGTRVCTTIHPLHCTALTSWQKNASCTFCLLNPIIIILSSDGN